jgi:predicted phosphodiesterase
MRVAALYDTHGNLPALEAVLDEVRGAGVDQIVVGGDVLPGPMPRETLALLFGLEIPTQFILGNGEVAVLAERAGQRSGVPEQFRDVVRWSGKQLSSEDAQLLANWSKTARSTVSGIGEVLFCHATPQNENDIFTRLTPAKQIAPAFAGLDVALVVCGHSHMQFDRTIGGLRVVNAGSVGMPFGKPGADWLLLGPDLQLRHTDYDLNKASKRVRATSYPQANDFAANNILQPPSEEKMLRAFTEK